MLPMMYFVDGSGQPYEPQYATELAAGFDLPLTGAVDMLPTGLLVRTGLFVDTTRTEFLVTDGGLLVVPYLAVVPKSGKSCKTAIRVSNAPGTVDADYPGEICIIVDTLVTPARELLEQIRPGNSIAQGIIQWTVRPQGGQIRMGGFGSTGG